MLKKQIETSKKDSICIFSVILIFSLIIFYGYLKNHFAADTFNIINLGYERYAVEFSLTDGRILMGIITLCANIIKLPITLYITILEILAIITSCIAVMLLRNIISVYKKTDNKITEILLIIACYYTIFNFTYIENMYFAECFVMALSILIYIWSANKLINSNSKKDYLKVLIAVFLGLICYQGTISAFLIMTIVLSLIKEKRNIIKNIVLAILVVGIGILLNYICIEIIEKIFNTTQTRGFNIWDIFINFCFSILNIPYILINTSKLFPKALYISLILILEIIVCIKLHKKDKEILVEHFLIILFGVFVAIIPSIINLTGYFSARMRFSIGAIIGLLFINLILKTNIHKYKEMVNKILIIFLLVYAIINSANYIYLIKLSNQVNRIDEKYVYEIDNYIDNYEKNNNIKVKNIAVIIKKQEIEKAYYKEMNCTGTGIAVSAVRTNWAAQGIINYYSNRNLQEKEPSEQEINEYLNKVDKNKEYMCISDTLYISIYMY